MKNNCWPELNWKWSETSKLGHKQISVRTKNVSTLRKCSPWPENNQENYNKGRAAIGFCPRDFLSPASLWLCVLLQPIKCNKSFWRCGTISVPSTKHNCENFMIVWFEINFVAHFLREYRFGPREFPHLDFFFELFGTGVLDFTLLLLLR